MVTPAVASWEKSAYLLAPEDDPGVVDLCGVMVWVVMDRVQSSMCRYMSTHIYMSIRIQIDTQGHIHI
jgi:hypothetical protein